MSMTAIRLSFREWLVVAGVMLAFVAGAPVVWTRVERLPSGRDARLAYDLGSDYWQYGRLCERSAAERKIAVIGDSVIWGHYVAQDRTLSHYLNVTAGRERFANLGLDGAHPAALQGLMAYYARAISGQTVLLHFNPLWLTSEKHDLSTTKEFEFNHAALVPQFTPKIPCYRASFWRRAAIAAQRYIPFCGWTAHLRIAGFGGLDLASWTLEHPYERPRGPTAGSPVESNPQSEIRNQQSATLQWVSPETSIQWRSFRETVTLLTARGNRLFVLVGPFNEHRLDAQDAATYDRIKKTVDAWLTARNVPHWIAPALPASMYADLSHPLAEGYERLAQQLMSAPAFRTVVGGPSDR
jgi:hypothetical protein